MRHNSNGFAVVEVLLVTIVLFVAAFAGWRVYESTVTTGDLPVVQATHKRIVAVGDIVCDPSDAHYHSNDPAACQDAKTAQLAAAMNPDAILALGDLQYDNGALAKFQNAFAQNWGALKSKLYPAPGNHEYGTTDASGYFAYFKDAPTDASKGYYGFSLGDWYVVSLNSNCEKIGGCGEGSAQAAWLEAELSQHARQCTLAFWHHPRFTSGRYLNDAGLKNLTTLFWEKLSAHKADVILNGHDHLYERFAPQTPAGAPAANGIRQFTVGTGGKSLYQKTGTAANSEKVVDNQFGVLVIDTFSDSYTWRFINTDNQVLDSGQQACN